MNTPAEKLDWQPEKVKKLYAKPSLQIYGGVLELTRIHGPTGTKIDNGGITLGGGGTSKTS